jgi:hypothetical protein
VVSPTRPRLRAAPAARPSPGRCQGEGCGARSVGAGAREFFFNQLGFATLFDPNVFSHFTHTGVFAGNLIATLTLAMLVLISVALVAATIIVPLRSSVREAGWQLAIGGTVYFALIGLGFMMIEIALLQRMSVFQAGFDCIGFMQKLYSSWLDRFLRKSPAKPSCAWIVGTEPAGTSGPPVRTNWAGRSYPTCPKTNRLLAQ